MRRASRLFVACTVVLAVVLGGFSGTVAAEEEEACTTGCIEDPSTDPPEVSNPDDDDTVQRVENKAAATRVRKAFLQAKKAFHEARQEIQAIKKGEADPADVPTFFDSDETDDTDDETT